MHRFFVRGLLSLYFTVGFAPSVPGQSLLDAQWMAEATPAAVQALLDQGTKVNARDWDGVGFTPLHRAARHNKNPAVVALLLDRGADAKLRDREGTLPVDLADKNEALKGTDVYWRLHDAQF